MKNQVSEYNVPGALVFLLPQNTISNYIKTNIQNYCIYLFILMLIFFIPMSARGEKMAMTITPILMIEQEYTDNLKKTKDNKKEEWITSYHLGLIAGFKGKKTNLFLEYAPEYKDYYNDNKNDTLEHNAKALLRSNPSKQTRIEALIVYDGHGENEDQQDWRHQANLSFEARLSKTFSLLMEENYSRQFQRQKSTGIYKEYDRNISRLTLNRHFGEKNSIAIYGEYGFVDYDNIDEDTNDRYKAGTKLMYWFTRLNGLESELDYERKLFDNYTDNFGEKNHIASGHIKYLRRINPNLESFAKYRHYYSERGQAKHHVFHPSLGINWNMTEDSGVSLGIGALFNKWNNENEDEVYPFLELDIYKEFHLSPRASILFAAASRYDAGDEMISSLGYNTVYEGSVQFNYQLTKRLSSYIGTQYQYQKFYETRINREDQEVSLNAQLSWRPLEWLMMGIGMSHEQTVTDSKVSEFKKNSVFLYAKFLPKNPDKTKSISGERRLLTSPFEQAKSRNLSIKGNVLP